MACFIVSAAEAVVVTAVKKAEEKKELSMSHEEKETAVAKIPLSKKLSWLSNMLWGGVILLTFEHLWHGEIVPYFPFLTAMYDPSDTAEMLHEMATVGVGMAVLITAIWAVMCVAADAIAKRNSDPAKDTIG